jgi:hypothetical protein
MTNITNAIYSSANNNHIHVDFDGVNMLVPVDSSNRHYAEIVEQEIVIAAYVVPELIWEDKRIAAYGSIGDQLDQQYHDLVDGTTIWKDHITKIKSDFPKPE